MRNSRRFAAAEPIGRRVMTIQRAKNREFADVVDLWPQSVPKDEETAAAPALQQRWLVLGRSVRKGSPVKATFSGSGA